MIQIKSKFLPINYGYNQHYFNTNNNRNQQKRCAKGLHVYRQVNKKTLKCNHCSKLIEK